MKSGTQIKRAIQRTFHRAGWDIHRITQYSNPHLQFVKALEHFNINIIFDVGANTGQFASEIRFFDYKGKIISFEPLADAHRSLTGAASKDPLWIVHPRTAIGDFEGETMINVSANSFSSSVLPMLEAHATAETESAYIGSEKIPIICLDSIAASYLVPDSRLFFKIDTQGFEWQVLDGAKDLLKSAQGVQCELSLVSLYQGQRLWSEMLQRMSDEGFTLWSMNQTFIDPRDGRTLQVDATFFRT